MSWWTEWRDERSLRLRARAYVSALAVDPPEPDVAWMAQHGTQGDADHARWELRYARLVVAYLVAQRDALNDRTPAAVAHALTWWMSVDRRIDARKLRLAERQFNERLQACSDAMRRTDDPALAAQRLARVVLRFAVADGAAPGVPTDIEAAAAGIIARYIAEAADRLGNAFGVTHLPDEIAPSEFIRTHARG